MLCSKVKNTFIDLSIEHGQDDEASSEESDEADNKRACYPPDPTDAEVIMEALPLIITSVIRTPELTAPK